MKKNLLITHCNPFDFSSGGNQRTSFLLSSLLQFYAVDVICFTKDEPPQLLPQNCSILFWRETTPIKYERLKRYLGVFKCSLDSFYLVNKYCKYIVNSILESNDYEFIVIRYIQNVCLCGLETSDNLIVDVDDLPEQVLASILKETNAGLLKRVYYFYLLKKINISTTKFLSHIRHSFFSNPNQCNYRNSSYLPNIPYIQEKIVDDVTFFRQKNIILFVGFLEYSPNYMGLDYFITKIWVNILKCVPDAELRIIGKGLPGKYLDSWKKYSRISVLGYVRDLPEEYKKCKVAIVPIYSGGGSNIKVLEAMSLKRPCVVSEFATRGFEKHLKDGWSISCIPYTIISTCKMQGVPVLQYLKEFFKQIVLGRTDYENLLPMTIGITNNKH